ncbi:methylmalonyl-CoA mutase family protein [Fulvivirga sp.]|uniref:methylmalonyl-CoA mutase family protein n=1 Tax=Fulvivirga sp. TaxID=1931237 RepID=UPI0032EE023E
MDKNKPLFSQFKKVSKEDWAKKATSDLKGEDVYEMYQWNKGDLTISPYYDKSDLADISNLELFGNRLYKNNDPSGDPRVWVNLQRIFVEDSSDANSAALEGLNNGADGITFDLSTAKNINLNILLKAIKPAYCYLSFEKATKADGLKIITHLSSEFQDVDIHGHISIEDIEPNDALNEVSKFKNLKNFTCINITSTESAPTEQISQTLAHVNRQVRSLLLHGFDIASISKSILVSLEVGNDFFVEIAKVRALRNLIFQIFRAYGHDEFQPEDISIRCISTNWNEEKYQPHANMLKGSTAALASILAGCDLLEVEPEFNDSPQSVRIARNVSNILKEESYLSKTADPVAGTYYLESLTDQIAKESWKLFQKSLENVKMEG